MTLSFSGRNQSVVCITPGIRPRFQMGNKWKWYLFVSLFFSVCVCVRVCVHVCVRMRIYACVRAHVHACVRACVVLVLFSWLRLLIIVKATSKVNHVLCVCVVLVLLSWLLETSPSNIHVSESQERMCSGSFTWCHTEIQVTAQASCLLPEYTDTGPLSPGTNPINIWLGSHYSASLKSLVWLGQDLNSRHLYSRQTLNHQCSDNEESTRVNLISAITRSASYFFWTDMSPFIIITVTLSVSFHLRHTGMLH